MNAKPHSKFLLCKLFAVTLLVSCAPMAATAVPAEPEPFTLATSTRMASKTPVQVLPSLTKSPTKTPTERPTSTFTNTPLPPLPDFQDVITFASGAGGGPCMEQEYAPNYLDVWVSPNGERFNICYWLWGMDLQQPFQIVLTQPGISNGAYLHTAKLFFDSSGKVLGKGFPTQTYFGYWNVLNTGTLAGYFNIQTPTRLAPGVWRFSIVQDSGRFGMVSVDSQVEEDRYTFITVHSNRPADELLPASGAFNPYKLILPGDDGNIDVSGENFPANTPIYVLLYRSIPDSLNEWMLIEKRSVLSDVNGSIHAELTGSYSADDSYLLIGLSDPNTPLEITEGLFHNLNFELPFKPFQVEMLASSVSGAGSCPGAPPQRMTVNGRGYVCTQSDPVRLRASPSRAAGVLTELATGTQFTVIGGPSCSDNWSWWQVQFDNGMIGWVAEGGDDVDPYFICPQ